MKVINLVAKNTEEEITELGLTIFSCLKYLEKLTNAENFNISTDQHDFYEIRKTKGGKL